MKWPSGIMIAMNGVRVCHGDVMMVHCDRAGVSEPRRLGMSHPSHAAGLAVPAPAGGPGPEPVCPVTVR
jgi:hypothetical protein